MNHDQDMNQDARPEETEETPADGEQPEALEQERDEFRDRYQRALAETENLRKRHQRDMKDARQYAVSELARDLLTVVDDLQRALGGVPADREADAFVTGVRLVEERFLKTLADHGVEPVEALSQPFDPMFHEAIMEDDRDDLVPGTITEELLRGYKLGERLLRAAVVKVARAPSGAARKNADSSTTVDDDETPAGD